MDIAKTELSAILANFNPWWRKEKIDLPKWRRTCFQELFTWVYQQPAPRAVLLSGARQVGKTTLLLQVIEKLLDIGIPAANILYVTCDHPLIKLAGIDAVLNAWRERELKADGPEYIFIDEAQFIRDWGTWVKHQVDFIKDRRIIFTGSSMPLLRDKQESGVGRWHTIRLATLSFYEYLQLKKISVPEIPPLTSGSLIALFEWQQKDFKQISEKLIPYIGQFNEYLIRGGFPQTAQVENIAQAQRLLREDIIDKALKRDMTALFGVRNILELEQTFLYLCMHDSGLLDIKQLCSNLALSRPTVQRFIDWLEALHLVYRLQPFGYGKEILRAKSKVYLADAAIAPAVLLRGKELLDDSQKLAIATETAVFKHLFARYYQQSVSFTYWQNKKGLEVDLIADIAGQQLIAFEIKYRTQKQTGLRNLKGLLDFCQKKSIARAYVVTKSAEDFNIITTQNVPTKILHIPAPLLCYWLGQTEIDSTQLVLV